jgi:hypothetical protein
MDRMELLPRNLTPQPHFADGYSAKPQGEDPKQLLRFRSGNRGRAAHPPARGAGTANGHSGGS